MQRRNFTFLHAGRVFVTRWHVLPSIRVLLLRSSFFIHQRTPMFAKINLCVGRILTRGGMCACHFEPVESKLRIDISVITPLTVEEDHD